MQTRNFLPYLLGLVFVVGYAPNSNAAIKCWKNNDGVRECGNAVPPEYAQQGHEERSQRGLVMDKQARAKTPEEIEEARVQEERDAEQARLDKIQAAKDRVLLDTFSNVDDMELARDGQLANITSQVKLNESQINKLERDIDERIAAAAELERRGTEPPEEIQNAIESLRSQIARKRTFIENKLVEQVQVRDKFDADIGRFRELKGGDY